MLSIIGFVFIIVMTVLAYKTAKDYERNPFGWATITFFAVFGIQILLPVFIGLVIGIVMIISGTPETQLQQRFEEKVPVITITIACLILSIVAGFLVIRHLAKIPEENLFDKPPDPPADFN